MSGVATDIQTDFALIAGDGRALSEPEACAEFTVDGITPGCVLRPLTAEQVAEMLRCAAAHELAVIPCANITKLGIGAPPQRYDAALSLRDLNRTTYYEPDDLVVSVEPGMTFGALQQMLAERKLWLPLDPAGGEHATIGGILAANSAGPLRLRYGGPRDIVLGMKIATAEGKIIKTGGRVVKNVAGYDLAKLLIGSYGTLGVIVEATFKLYPQVATRTTWAIEIESFTAAREFRRRLLASPLGPLRAAVLNAEARMEMKSCSPENVSNSRAVIWIEAGGSERVIGRYDKEVGALAAQVDGGIRRVDCSEAEEVWNNIADFGNGLVSKRQDSVVLRGALPISGGEEFLECAEQESQAEGLHVAGILQVGVGIVEMGLRSIPNPEPRIASPASIEKLRRLAADFGGSLVVTHCPADLKSKIDVWGPVGDDFEVMRKLKAAWDPKSTLAPGRGVGRM